MKIWNNFLQRRESRRAAYGQIKDLIERVKALLEKSGVIFVEDRNTLSLVAKLEADIASIVDLYDSIVDEWNILDYFLDGDEVREQLRYVKIMTRTIQHLKYDFMSGK
jgi:hypothetical protein